MDEALEQGMVPHSNSAALSRLEEQGQLKGDPPVVSTDTSEVVEGIKLGKDEEVVVLETSTSTTPMATNTYFDPGDLYELNMNVTFFDMISKPDGPGLLDWARRVEPCKEDVLDVGGTVLEGTENQTLTFTVSGNRHEFGWSDSSIKVKAANNGMLNVARLASAFITVRKMMQNLPPKLTIVAKVTMGTDPKGADADSRKEAILTSVVPSLDSKAAGTGAHIMGAMIGALGFGKEVKPSALTAGFVKSREALGSARAQGDTLRDPVLALWGDRPEQRTFIENPDLDMGGWMVEALEEFLGPDDAEEIRQGAGEKRDYAPGAVRSETGGNMPNQKKTIEAAGNVGARLKNALIASMAAGLAREVSPEFGALTNVVTARWVQAVESAFSRISWKYWYDYHFEDREHGPATSSPGNVVLEREGSGEGMIRNHIPKGGPE